MKVLFIGDGAHDVGTPSFSPTPRPPAGVVSTLCRSLQPAISQESVALSWVEIPRLNKTKRGLKHKLVAATELAIRHGCVATIAVVDQDRDRKRLESLREGQSKIQNHRTAVGMAIESIEAWTLGAPLAIAQKLNISTNDLTKFYSPTHVESYYENSGKQELRPKGILQRITESVHLQDDAVFRADVAELTDLNELEMNCPQGFGPFAADVRRVIGSV